MAKFGKELGGNLPRGMPTSSLPSSAITTASSASTTMLPPRLSSNNSSFTSIDSAFSTRVVGSSSTFDLPTRDPASSGGAMRPPRESKRKASQLGGSGGADSFSSAYPVSRKDSESTDGDFGIQLGGDMLGSGLLPIAERNHLLPLLKGGSSGKQAAPTPRATTKGSGKASAKQQQQQLAGAGAGGSSSSHAPRAECAADEPGMIEL